MKKVDKARSRMMMIITIATFVSVFSLVSVKTLISQATYQRNVLAAKRQAVEQLQDNTTKARRLSAYYNDIFIGTNPDNVIGGRNTSDANAIPPNGDNARIVLNALPTTYDFPALITSVNKLLSNNGISSPSISGTDESASVSSAPVLRPQPVSIRLVVSGSASYQAVQNLIRDFERSTRPFDITNLQIRGNEASVSFTLAMDTYFQPATVYELEQREP